MMNDDIKKACDVMQAGGLILYPTDTIWGIGCDATNPQAVQKVFDLKQRADNKALLVLLDSPSKLDFYVSEVPDIAWDLIEMSLEPLTIIYSQGRNLASNLISSDGSIGIRITKGLPRRSSQNRSASVSASPSSPLLRTSAACRRPPTSRKFRRRSVAASITSSASGRRILLRLRLPTFSSWGPAVWSKSYAERR